MLWHKAWRDTRWRFLIGLAALSGMALVCVFAYPSVQGLHAVVLYAGPNAALTREINWFEQLSATLRGYIWVQFVHQNMYVLWTLFAVLLGADGPFSQRTGAVFTLSLPVSRRRVCAVRATTDLAELFLLALIPMLLITLAAPAIGDSYALADALVYGSGIFVGGTVFYCLTLLLTAVFEDRWRPITIVLAVAIAVEVCKFQFPAIAAFTPAGVMDGESYFRTGSLAWAGSFTWAAVSAATLYAAIRSTEARDF